MPLGSVWMDSAKIGPKKACRSFSLIAIILVFPVLLSILGTTANTAVVEVLAILIRTI